MPPNARRSKNPLRLAKPAFRDASRPLENLRTDAEKLQEEVKTLTRDASPPEGRDLEHYVRHVGYVDEHHEPWLVVQTLERLPQYGTPHALQYVAKAMGIADDDVRAAAVKNAGKVNHAASAAILAHGLSDPSQPVRELTADAIKNAFALGNPFSRHERVVDALVRQGMDPNAWMRQTATSTLDFISRADPKHLKRHLLDPDAGVRAKAILTAYNHSVALPVHVLRRAYDIAPPDDFRTVQGGPMRVKLARMLFTHHDATGVKAVVDELRNGPTEPIPNHSALADLGTLSLCKPRKSWNWAERNLFERAKLVAKRLLLIRPEQRDARLVHRLIQQARDPTVFKRLHDTRYFKTYYAQLQDATRTNRAK